MARDALASTPDLDISRIQLRLRRHAGPQWCGITIRPHRYASAAIHGRETHLRQIHALLGESTQKVAFADHQRAGRLAPVTDPALRIFSAGLEQMLIQIRQIANLWHRHKVVAAKISNFAFHSALFLSFRRITKLGSEPPMRPEHDKALRLLAPVAAQHLLYCSSQVVVAKTREYAAKPGKR